MLRSDQPSVAPYKGGVSCWMGVQGETLRGFPHTIREYNGGKPTRDHPFVNCGYPGCVGDHPMRKGVEPLQISRGESAMVTIYLDEAICRSCLRLNIHPRHLMIEALLDTIHQRSLLAEDMKRTLPR